MQKKNPLFLEPETVETSDFQQSPKGIELDDQGCPVGVFPIQEFYDVLGHKLIAHFGEDFRLLLNASREERGMKTL
jgi:hypothetical protein